jgi:DNA polymerase III delta subunit
LTSTERRTQYSPSVRGSFHRAALAIKELLHQGIPWCKILEVLTRIFTNSRPLP